MSNVVPCPQCGRPLTSEIPGGLCPECLLAGGLNPTEAVPSSPAPGVLSPEQLALSFPELHIEALVGFGGMGAVYRARQIKLDRIVALKVIHPEAAKDAAFAERFEREARAMAQLSHPHIVTIHDFDRFELEHEGESKTLFYILMEYVDGADLRAILDEDRLEPAQALSIVQQVCEALQFAHDAGVVHRDIKPENILIDRQGMTRIADFGLAKLAEGAQHNFTLTGTHQVVGTPRYMAPEQLEGGKTIDHRADLYSLGVVFYEMLTGELPLGRFDLPSDSGVADERLDDVILRTLAKEPAKRYQTASEIRDDVRALSETPPVPPVRPPTREPGYAPVKTPINDVSAAPSAPAVAEPPLSPVATAIYPQILLGMTALGAVSAFLPWSRLRTGEFHSNQGLLTLDFWGYQYVLPLIASLLCVIVLVYSYVLWLNGRRLHASRALMAIGAGTFLILIGAACVRAVPVIAINAARPSWIDTKAWYQLQAGLKEHYASGLGTVEVFAQVGPGVAVAVGLFMIAASVWELTMVARHSLTQGYEAATSPLRIWLRRAVLIQWGTLLFSGGLLAYWISSLPPGKGPQLLSLVMYATIGQVIVCLCATPLMWMAARRLESRRLSGVVRAAAIACMIPLGPGSVISFPLGIWLWNATQSPVIETALNPAPQPDIQHDLRHTASCLAMVGLVQLLLWIAAIVVLPSGTTMGESQAPTMASIVLPVALMLPMVVLNAVLWSSGRAMKRLDDNGQARTALWLGLIPLGPGWLLTFPLSIAGLSMVSQFEAKMS